MNNDLLFHLTQPTSRTGLRHSGFEQKYAQIIARLWLETKLFVCGDRKWWNTWQNAMLKQIWKI